MRTVVAAIITAGDAAVDRTGQSMVDVGGAWQHGHQSPTWWTEQGGGRAGQARGVLRVPCPQVEKPWVMFRERSGLVLWVCEYLNRGAHEITQGQP